VPRPYESLSRRPSSAGWRRRLSEAGGELDPVHPANENPAPSSQRVGRLQLGRGLLTQSPSSIPIGPRGGHVVCSVQPRIVKRELLVQFQKK
jgi:hypothetical protein